MDDRWVNRQWMYDRLDLENRSLKESFCAGLSEFITFAVNQDPQWKDGEKIRCPCVKCKNIRFHPSEIVSRHLIRRGFQQGYWNWIAHGEPMWTAENNDDAGGEQYESNIPDELHQWGNYEDMTWDQRMVYDAAVPTFE